MNIKEQLINNDIAFLLSGGELMIWCPFCEKINTRGNCVLTFHINQETGVGQCQTCLGKCNLEELNKKLGLKPELKEVTEEINSIKLPRIWTLTDIFSKDFGNEEWLIKDLIPLPSMTAMSGNPGNFKTWITIALAQSIAEGQPFLGHFPVKQGSVLIVDEEDHMRHIKKRLLQLNVSSQLPIFYISQECIKIDETESYNSLRKLINDKNISLIILDSLVRIHTREENDAKQMAFVMNKFMLLIKDGISVLFTHHHRKQAAWGPNNASQSLRGSSDILAAVDCHLTIEKVKEENSLIIRQEKLRTAPTIDPFSVTIESQPESMRFVYAGAHDNKKTKTEEAKEAIIQLLEEESQLFRNDFQERLTTKGIAGKQAIDTAIKDLQEEAIIELVSKEDLLAGDRKKKCYKLTKLSSQLPNHIDSRETGKE
mgnify:CR=1 FL=1